LTSSKDGFGTRFWPCIFWLNRRRRRVGQGIDWKKDLPNGFIVISELKI